MKKMMTVVTKSFPLLVMILVIGGFVLLTKAAPVVNPINRTWTDTFNSNSTLVSGATWDSLNERITLSDQASMYPQLLGGLSLNANATKITYDHNNAVYVGAGTNGVIKVDVTNPASMSITGSNVMERQAQDVYFSNATGTDTIYVPERLYVSAATNTPDPEIGGIEMLNALTMGYTKYPANNNAMDLYDYSTIKMNGTIGYAGVVDPSNNYNYIGVETIDFSGPTHVGVLSSTDMANQPVIYDSALDSSYFYVTHDIAPQNVNVNGVPVTYTGMVTVFDVTNTNSPATTSLTYKTENAPYSIVSSGRYVYVANGTSIDILDSGFTKVNSIDTGAEVRDMVVNGSTLYIANGANGLAVYNIQSPTSPVFVGGMSNLSGGTAYGVYYDSVTQRAYVADGVAGIMVVSVPSPNVSLQSSYPFSTGVNHVLYDGYAYIAAGGNGVQIVNLGNGAITSMNLNLNGEEVKGVTVSNGSLYIAYDNTLRAGVRMYSLANKTNPTYVKSYTSNTNGSLGNSIVVDGSIGYVMAGYTGVEVLNLATNPITNLATISLPGSAERGKLVGTNLFVASQNGGLNVIDTGTRTLKATYPTSGLVRDVDVSGHYAYLAVSNGNANSNLLILDTTNVNTNSFSLVGRLNLNMYPQGIAADGNYVYVVGSDNRNNSLFTVTDIATPSTPSQVYRYSPGAGVGKAVSVGGSLIYVTTLGRGLDVYGTSYNTFGTAISPVITVNPTRKWGYLVVDDTVPPSTHIDYYLRWNSNGNFGSVVGPLPVMNINYNGGRVYDVRSYSAPDMSLEGDLSTNNNQYSPAINQWTVTYDPVMVTSTTPTNNSNLNADCSYNISITFSGAIDTQDFNSNLNSYVSISPNNNSSMYFTGMSYDPTGTVIQLRHPTFQAGVTYTVTIHGGKDVMGLPFDASAFPYSYSFMFNTCRSSGGGGGGGSSSGGTTNTNVNAGTNSNTNGGTSGGNTNTNGGTSSGGINTNSSVCTNNETPSVPFTDITGHWAETYIEALRLRCILSGVSAGVFAPNQSITRAEFTKIVLKGFHIPVNMTVTEKPFLDVETTAWYAPYIAVAKAKGIVMGYPNGNFKPDQAIDRVEALKILLLASGVDLSDTVVTPEKMFIDTFADEWYAVYVVYSKEHNIITGYRDTAGNLTGYFGPGNAITRAESAKVLYSVMQTLGLL
jgi:hypothetical protein